MEKFIFTFGTKHLYDGFYQPIYAKDFDTARKMMIEAYGFEWHGQYYEEEWEKITKAEQHRITHPLTLIHVYEE